MNFQEILREFEDIIVAVEILNFQEDEQISRLKIKLRLVDASSLRIREVTRKNQIIAYSYFWLHEDESVIMGWDNAPHHREVKTFLHHKHIGNRVEPSSERDLKAVLQFVRNFLE